MSAEEDELAARVAELEARVAVLEKEVAPSGRLSAKKEPAKQAAKKS